VNEAWKAADQSGERSLEGGGNGRGDRRHAGDSDEV
jgi:hypothetical protein